MKKLIILTSILVFLDQLTKFLFQEKVYQIFSIFSIHYTQNTGAAFGILKGFNLFFIIISILVIFGIFKYYKHYKLPLTILLAGTIGNLVDRIFFGFVRDFISIGSFPIFNLADSFNTIAAILLIVAFYKEEKAYKSVKSKEK
jgi:signal peptidase II